MHTKLLNIGFIEIAKGVYRNHEIGVTVKVINEDTIEVDTPEGPVQTSYDDLEEAVVMGAFE